MRLTRTGKPDNFYYYVIEDYKNDKGQKKTRTVESLGCARVIREKLWMMLNSGAVNISPKRITK